MNQGKLEVIQQEMARVNNNNLGISILKWTGMGEFNSNDHYIYYRRQESLRRNGVAIMVNKSLKSSSWMQSIKRQNNLCSFPRQMLQYHSNPSLCPNQECWRSWSWTVPWRSKRPSTTNTAKRCPFHYRGRGHKSRKSKNTWSKRKICLWSTEGSRAKVNKSSAKRTHWS